MTTPVGLFRQRIVGEKVTAVSADESGVGLSLGRDWRVTIWSRSVIVSSDPTIITPATTNLLQRTLLAFLGNEVEETLSFSGGLSLVVYLEDRPDEQPEAMLLQGPNTLIVVWND